MLNNTDLVQENLENNSQNFFFNHVKEVIESKRKENIFEKELDGLYLKIKNNQVLSNNDFELLGILSFLAGVDYTGMSYLQKDIIENVHKRFEDVKVTEENLKVFENIIIELKDKNLNTFIDNAIASQKDLLSKEIEVSNENIVSFKLLKSKLNKFIDSSIIPIQFSIGAVELKRNKLTWENLLKFNSLLNEQAIYTGNSVKKFIEVYSDQFFNTLLKTAGNIFNEVKYAIIYEESIVSLIESAKRFEPYLTFNPNVYSDNEYELFKEKYIEKREKELEEIKIKEQNSNEYKPLSYTKEQVKQLMNEVPDEFVILNLQESGKFNSFENTEDIIKSIYATANNTDFVQHIYQYLRSNLENPVRQKGITALSININKVITDINLEIKTLQEKYKNLVEINCAEIPEEQIERIVNMVNDTIKACYLQTNDQKQYLISQLIENSIKTWNHLQQILSIIETCNILGSESDTYTNLINYIKEKSNIVEVFDNAEKLNEIQIQLQIFIAYRDWFKFHENIIEKTESEA